MRLLFWAEFFWPYIGGVEVLGMKLARALRERGHELAVVTSHGDLELPDEDAHAGLRIHRFRFLEALAARRLDLYAEARRRLVCLKQAFRPDLVHMNSVPPSALLHWQTRSYHPAPTLVAVHSPLPDQNAAAETLVGRTLRAAAWVTANSRAMLEDVRRLVPEISDRSSVIYNGLEMPELAPESLPFEAPMLLCAGRVVRDKGFDVAISAFATVRRRFPKARLVIAGDGPARAELEQQAAEMGVREAVDFLGWVPPEKIPALMNSATLALMPSRWREAFGLVALQAMQMARPVVASDVGGLPEVVAHGETGLVVPKEDPEVVAQAVTRLLENPSLAQEMGAAGRRRASLLFGFDRYFEEHEILYRRLLKETRHDQFELPLDATL